MTPSTPELGSGRIKNPALLGVRQTFRLLTRRLRTGLPTVSRFVVLWLRCKPESMA